MGQHALEAADPVLFGNEYGAGATDEQAALDNADDSLDALLQPLGVRDRTEVAIQDAVSALSGEGPARWRQA